MENQLLSEARETVRQWWVPLIVGIFMLVAGIYTFINPEASYQALSIIFSIAFLMSGILEIVFAISNRKSMKGWGWTLALGILTTVLGVLLITHPAVTMASLPFYVGFMVMFTSFWSIGTALDLKDAGVMDWGTLMVLAVLGIIFSFILIWNPEFGGLALVFWVGIALIVSSVVYIYNAFQMRKINKNWDNLSEEAKERYLKAKQNFNDEIQNINGSK